mmetsp:Transcript_86871/g.281301  ORF Transcript_86871/g.281301 Transcript_86871/m.281301 type:complete len:229 (-) Transcript_86871:335-1021(-)
MPHEGTARSSAPVAVPAVRLESSHLFLDLAAGRSPWAIGGLEDVVVALFPQLLPQALVEVLQLAAVRRPVHKVVQLITVFVEFEEQPRQSALLGIALHDILPVGGGHDAAPGHLRRVCIARGLHELQQRRRGLGLRRRRAAPNSVVRVVVAPHACRRLDATEAQRCRCHVHVVEHRFAFAVLDCQGSSAANDKGDADALLPRAGLPEATVRAVHVAVVREEDDVRVAP